MGHKLSERRIVMARSLAKRWLEAHTRPEHRLTIFYVGKEARGIPNLLRSFRDAKLRIGSMDPILDLGVQEDFDSVTVWSSDRDAVVRLASWFEQHGYDTTGVW
jgi:hypothetical protein